MNLLGRELPVRALLDRIEARLQLRGLREAPTGDEALIDEVEPRVDPLSFNLGVLEEHADPTRPLPLHTHRGGAGQVVVAAKWAFRKTCQVFINEALSRQRLFNGHVRDSYAQLAAEVIRLRAEVATLKAQAAAAETSPRRASVAAEQPAAPRRPSAGATLKAPAAAKKIARPAQATTPSGAKRSGPKPPKNAGSRQSRRPRSR